jgi:predicted Fe-S protein YdhL (DUF1289 family)
MDEIFLWPRMTTSERQRVLDRLSREGRSRMDIIGQNGNDGDHYES